MNLDNFELEDILLSAIKSEVESNKLYTKMAKKTKNGLLEDKLNFLADEEEKHLKTFQDFYNTLKEKAEITPYNWEEAKLYLEALVDSKFFASPEKAINMAKEAKDELEAIDSAINFEKDTLLFFYQILEMIKSQELVKKIIEQEKKHIQSRSCCDKHHTKGFAIFVWVPSYREVQHRCARSAAQFSLIPFRWEDRAYDHRQ